MQKIALICAMPEEVSLYLAQIQNSQCQVKAGMSFYQGQLSGQEVILVQCGVGKVHAALCAGLCIAEFNATAILFSGVAGALAPDLDIGDLIVSNQTMQHDMDVSALGFPVGQIPWTQMRLFDCDLNLIQRCIQAGTHLNYRIRPGRVLSGDQFVADPVRVAFLRDELKGDCVEMEAGAVGQVCALYGNFPFITLRAISDKADHSSPVDFPSFCQEAADRSARLVMTMLHQWNSSSPKSL